MCAVFTMRFLWRAQNSKPNMMRITFPKKRNEENTTVTTKINHTQNKIQDTPSVARLYAIEESINIHQTLHLRV